MIFSFLFIYIFVVNIVYFVVHIVCDCEVDVIANSLVLYLPFCSTLNKKILLSLSLTPAGFSLAISFFFSAQQSVSHIIAAILVILKASIFNSPSSSHHTLVLTHTSSHR